jgi:hypothetical protein
MNKMDVMLKRISEVLPTNFLNTQGGFAPVDVDKNPSYKELFLWWRLKGRLPSFNTLHKSDSSVAANKPKIGRSAALLYALQVSNPLIRGSQISTSMVSEYLEVEMCFTYANTNSSYI